MSDPWPPPPTDPRPAGAAEPWTAEPPASPPMAPPAAPPTAPSPADPAAGGGGRRPIVLVAVAGVALLAAGVAWGMSTAGDDGGPGEQASARTEEAEEPEPTTPPTERISPPTTEEREERPAGDPHPMMQPTGDAPLDAAIADAARFVEEARELEFTEEVAVEALDGDRFVARLREEVEGDEEYLEYLDQLGDRLVALGLLSPDGDPVDTYLSLLDQGVLGFYDPESGELVVRGTEPSLFLQSIIVHELTHALDDQHFELDRPEVEANDEHSFGFAALVEGNASTVEALWVDELSAAERAQLEAEELAFGLGLDPGEADVPGDLDDLGDLGELFDGLGLGDLEEELGDLDLGSLEDDLTELEELFEGLDLGELDEQLGDLDLGDLDLGFGLDDMGDLLVLQEILMAPYEEGEELVEALLDEDGMARVDAAYAEPPISSEQVLEPERYLDGEPVVDVAVPPAEGRAVVDGWFGQYFLRLLLESELDGDEVDRAADGWAGDRFVQWEAAGARCVRIDIATDTDGDREELADALEEWAVGQSDATVSVEGELVRLTSCN